jgi:hypothetical protein
MGMLVANGHRWPEQRMEGTMPARPACGWAVALVLVVVFALACRLPTVRPLLLVGCILLAAQLGDATRLPAESPTP